MSSEEQKQKRLEYGRVWRAKNRTTINAAAKIRYAANREENREYRKQYYVDNKDAARWRLIKKAYGIDKAQWESMFVAQHECCAICKTLLFGRYAHVDHNHETGIVRGLLCHHCNTGLGSFRENTEFLRSAVDYLVKFT